VETRVLALLKKLGTAGRFAPLNAARPKPARPPPAPGSGGRRGGGGGGGGGDAAGGGGGGGSGAAAAREVPPKKRPHATAAAAVEPEEAPPKKPRPGVSKCAAAAATHPAENCLTSVPAAPFRLRRARPGRNKKRAVPRASPAALQRDNARACSRARYEALLGPDTMQCVKKLRLLQRQVRPGPPPRVEKPAFAVCGRLRLVHRSINRGACKVSQPGLVQQCTKLSVPKV